MNIQNGCLISVDKNDIISGTFLFPQEVTSIGSYAFKNCPNLTHIVIPGSVKSIGDNAFRRCPNLTRVIIRKGVESIGDSAFKDCTSLIRMFISEGVTSIENYAFAGCSNLAHIVIPKSIHKIKFGIFKGCTSLTRINIPEDVTAIGMEAFSGCISLTRIDIPEGVTGIGIMAFKGCTSLTHVFIPGSIRLLFDDTFDNCHRLIHIVIITPTVEEFKRMRSTLPAHLRSKAKDINSEIYGHMSMLEQIISAPASQGEEQQWADPASIAFSIQRVQSLLDDINGTAYSTEQQKKLDSLVVRLYIQLGQLDDALTHFNSYSGVSSNAAFELASGLFASEKPNTEKCRVIIHLFKEYHEDNGIHELLEKAVLELLSNNISTVGTKLASYGVSRCVPCSAIIKTISESTLDKDLIEQFKAMRDKLPLLTATEMNRLLSASPLEKVLKEKYGSTDIVTYESLLMMSNPQEIQDYRTHDNPIEKLNSGTLKNILDEINAADREGKYKKIISSAVLLVTPKKNNETNDIRAVQLLTETNLGLFAQSSFSEQSDVNYLDQLLCDGRKAPWM